MSDAFPFEVPHAGLNDWEQQIFRKALSHYENTLNVSDMSTEVEHVPSLERAHADIAMAAVTSVACALRTVFAISIKHVEHRENQENIELYSRAGYLYGKETVYRFHATMHDRDMSEVLGGDYRITENGGIPVGLYISMVMRNDVSRMDIVTIQTYMLLWVKKINHHPCLHMTL